MYDYACEYLTSKGYTQYEISNFAKSGYPCRHNLKYWECREYIGIGVAAHSYDGAIRRENTAVLADYLDGQGIGDIEAVLTAEDKTSEFMILGLRKTNGISEQEFFQKFGTGIDNIYGKELKKFIKGGFLYRQNGRIFLSQKGISVSNGVMCEFILK